MTVVDGLTPLVKWNDYFWHAIYFIMYFMPV